MNKARQFLLGKCFEVAVFVEQKRLAGLPKDLLGKMARETDWPSIFLSSDALMSGKWPKCLKALGDVARGVAILNLAGDAVPMNGFVCKAVEVPGRATNN